MTEVKILKDILEVNDVIADQNAKLFKDKGITVFNVMSSPGAGKTSLTIKTIEAAKADGIDLAVIEGDIASAIDAERIQETGVKAIQINTGGACHLDANMIRSALKHLDLDKLNALIIENVGNLVCPAEFKLGETYRIMLFSVTEGDDKPHKYPLMFTEADALVINKMDLLANTNFDMDHFRKTVLSMNPDLEIFEVSCTQGMGLDKWSTYFKSHIKNA
jgi:hydrogenase nickel incorporation protein HypB